ncbi:unnamed protein product [Brassica oleracea]|uniref:(rape) hypothetical protein n=1 Tax=Brassica napus TaxID=3708 RepID=A0A816KEZ3_BRANA|nr:unnamed protein product [Brassica napus]
MKLISGSSVNKGSRELSMATRMWKLVTNILILMLQFLVPRVERVLFYLVFR